MIASNLPDLDAVTFLGGYDYMVFGRRTITHSVLIMPFLALGLALAFRRWTSLKDPGPLIGLSLLGVFLHTGLDLFNSWGVEVFAPLSAARFGIGWLGIVDPWIWAILGVGLIAGLIRPVWSLAANRIALGLLVPWIMFCGAGHGLAIAHFRESISRLRVRPDRIEAYAQLMEPLRWSVVASTPAAYYQGDVHALAGLQGRVRVFFRTEIPEPLRGPFTASYFAWASAPLVRPLSADQGGGLALVDLRFVNRIGGMPFVARLYTDPLGRPAHTWLAWQLTAPAADQEYELPRL